MATVDVDSGDYELEFRNMDDPESGIEYERFMRVFHAVLKDFDRRMQVQKKTAAQEGTQDDVHVLGDEQSIN